MFNQLKTLWNKDKGFGFFCAVSALLHTLIFVSLIFTNSGNKRLLRNMNIVDVNLISISKAGGVKSEPAAKPKKSSEKPVTVKETKPKPKKEAEKKIVKEPVKEKAKTPPKKTVPKKNAKKVKKEAKKEEKKENKIQENSEVELAKVKNAIEKIRESMAENQPTDNSSNSISDTKEGEGGFSSQKNGRPGSIIGDIVTAYQAEVAWQIEQNWFFSEHTVGKQNIKAILIVEIMKNGEIKELYFETKSGSPYLDDSAYKAVLKSNPLPPLPEAFGVSTYKLGLTFTPSGIE